MNFQIAVGDNPGVGIGEGNIRSAFIYKARVSSPSGAFLGVVTREAPMDGFSELRFTTDPMSAMEGDEVGLFADDDLVGMLNVENGRVSYRLDVGWDKMGRDRATGEQVPMPPNFGVNFTATTINDDGQTAGSVRGEWQHTTHLHYTHF